MRVPLGARRRGRRAPAMHKVRARVAGKRRAGRRATRGAWLTRARAPRMQDKVLKLAKGFRGRAKNCVRIARQSVSRALQFAYRDRRQCKREFRSLWITRINAAARHHGVRRRCAEACAERRADSSAALIDRRAARGRVRLRRPPHLLTRVRILAPLCSRRPVVAPTGR